MICGEVRLLGSARACVTARQATPSASDQVPPHKGNRRGIMVSMLRRLSLAAVLVFSGAGSAFGGDYADPSGFSFTYPEGWIPLHRSMKDAAQALPPELKNWIAKNNVNLDRATVFLIRNGREEFLENLNVVIEKQQIP